MKVVNFYDVSYLEDVAECLVCGENFAFTIPAVGLAWWQQTCFGCDLRFEDLQWHEVGSFKLAIFEDFGNGFC